MRKSYEFDFEQINEQSHYSEAVATAENVAVGFRCYIGVSSTPNFGWSESKVQKILDEHQKALVPYIMTYLPEACDLYLARHEVSASLISVREIHRQAFSSLFDELGVPEEIELSEDEEVEEHARFLDFEEKACDKVGRRGAAKYIAKTAVAMLRNDMAVLQQAALHALRNKDI